MGGYEAWHIMALSGHKSESSIKSYAFQTSFSTKRKTSEISESLNNKKAVTTITAISSVGLSEFPVAESASEPLLTASKEEHFLNELSIEQSNVQKTVNNFYNSIFNFYSEFSEIVSKFEVPREMERKSSK